MKHIFLLNSFSLNTKTNDLKIKIERVCKEEKMDYKIEINSDKESTEEILERYKDKECIILPVGGDGTINRVLNAIVGTKNILGYIPYGTGNDFYRTNKELVKSGINEIDLGKINEKYFINVACFGVDADIANNSDIIHSKWIPKKQRYNIGILHNFLRYQSRKLKIEINNQTWEEKYTTVAVCNARYYGGGYRISPNSSLTDGLLEVYMIKETNKWEMFRLVSGIKNALHEKSKKTMKMQAKKLVIHSEEEIKCNIDGEVLPSNNFEIEVIPKGIKIYYNPKLIDKIRK